MKAHHILLLLAAMLPGPALSADSTCGEVSIFRTPPKARDLHPVELVKIGDNHKVHIRNHYKLSPGKHQVKVTELIQDPDIRIRSARRYTSKTLEVNVEAGKVYHLAAKFIRKNRFKAHKARYWEPVVWKVTERECQLN